jgi:hypothetical protein
MIYKLVNAKGSVLVSFVKGKRHHMTEQTNPSEQSLKQSRRSNNYQKKVSTTICSACEK